MKKIISSIFAFFLSFAVSSAFAISPNESGFKMINLDKATESQLNSINIMKSKFSDYTPNLDNSSFYQTPFPGIFAVDSGSKIMYFNDTAQYVFIGRLLDINNDVNVTDQLESGIRKKILSEVQDSETIIYKADNEKHVVYVFTDPDCPYCVKIHREVADYNAKGITVKYMPFPRSGIGRESHKKLVHAWCSDNQQQALTDIKNGGFYDEASCSKSSTVNKLYRMGKQIGVRATPTIVSENGLLLPGYVDAKGLLKKINTSN